MPAIGRKAAAVLVVLVVSLALGACVSRHGAYLYVAVPPPPMVREVVVAAPGVGYVWIGGYHRWEGRAHVWVAGRWELPPRRGQRWVAGIWREDRRHGWYWVEGRWR